MAGRIKKAKVTTFILYRRYMGLVAYAFGIFLFVLLVIKFFIIDIGQVSGVSMEPNFINGDVFAVNKFYYLFSSPKRYDVVQMVDLQNGKLIIKRIIGMPGEIVTIKRGKVFISTSVSDMSPRELEEKYLSNLRSYTATWFQKHPMRYLVGDDQYFVIGDNRANSGDSRVYGPVPRERIVGKVMGNLY